MQDTFAKRAGRIFLYIFGALFIIGATIFALMPKPEYVRQRIELETVGLPAQAKVVDKAHSRESADRQDGPRRSNRSSGIAAAARIVRATDRTMHDINNPDLVDVYYVDYRFATQQGNTIEASLKVSREDFNHIKVGGEVPVIYHPANPDVSRPLDYSQAVVDNGPAAKIILIVMAVITGLWFIGWGWFLSLKVTRSSGAWAEAGGNADQMIMSRSAPPAAQPSRSPAPTRRKQGFGQRAA